MIKFKRFCKLFEFVLGSVVQSLTFFALFSLVLSVSPVLTFKTASGTKIWLILLHCCFHILLQCREKE